jgi:hypothetical protein
MLLILFAIISAPILFKSDFFLPEIELHVKRKFEALRSKLWGIVDP